MEPVNIAGYIPVNNVGYIHVSHTYHFHPLCVQRSICWKLAQTQLLGLDSIQWDTVQTTLLLMSKHNK